MNIMDYMGEVGPTPDLSTQILIDLLKIRRETFYGFMRREHDQGIMFAPFDLRTPKGQDVARLLFWRCIEEYDEAVRAQDNVHKLEELIDCFNYASAGLVGLNVMPARITVEEWGPVWLSETPTQFRLGLYTSKLANVTEQFRNRSWMANAQSSYFDGYEEYRKAIFLMMRACAAGFPDWDTFYKFYMAKDAVLQFRLRSNY